MLAAKADGKLKDESPSFAVGPIVLGQKYAQAPRSVVRELHDHHGTYSEP